MSIYVIVFLSCLIDKNVLSCDVNYSKKVYHSKEQCEIENQLHLIKGQCVELKRD